MTYVQKVTVALSLEMRATEGVTVFRYGKSSRRGIICFPH